jgi:outer membrane usher protein
MPDASLIRLRLLLPAVAGSLCGSPHAGAELLTEPSPGLPRAAAVRPAPGVEINYELLTAPAAASAGPGRLEGVMSGARGEVRTSVLVNPYANSDQRLARLDTSWQAKSSGPLQGLVVGDTLGSGGGWSRPVRLGGIRLGRSLTLRQGMDTAIGTAIPVPAALPSFPVGTPPALAAGASDYEVEAGRMRSGWGTADDSYGEGYAAAAYREGLGAKLTAEARAEWTPSRIAAGLEMSRRVGSAGLLHAVVAQSATAQQSGLRWGMGLVRNAEGATWSLSWDAFDRGFTPVSGEADPRGRVKADATLPFGGGASAGIAYTRQTTWESPAAGVVDLSARFALPERSILSVNYSQRAGAQPGWQAGLTLAVPLGSNGQ